MSSITLPSFQFSTQEDWYWELVFVTPAGDAIPLTDRVFEVDVTGESEVDARANLTMGGGIDLKTGTTNVLAFRVAKSAASAWPQVDYTADVLEVVDGERHRYMPVRVTFAAPVRLLQSNVVSQQVAYAANQVAIVSPLSLAGPQGRPPAHRWVDAAGNPGSGPAYTYLQWANPDGSWGAAANLLGTDAAKADEAAAEAGTDDASYVTPAGVAAALEAQIAAALRTIFINLPTAEPTGVPSGTPWRNGSFIAFTD